MAIAQFKTLHPSLTCSYSKAGTSGIDIRGKDEAGRLCLIAEVKTTVPDQEGRIRGPQQEYIQKDLERLKRFRGKAELRYLVLLSAETKRAVQSQLRTDKKYRKIIIITAFDD